MKRRQITFCISICQLPQFYTLKSINTFQFCVSYSPVLLSHLPHLPVSLQVILHHRTERENESDLGLMYNKCCLIFCIAASDTVLLTGACHWICLKAVDYWLDRNFTFWHIPDLQLQTFRIWLVSVPQLYVHCAMSHNCVICDNNVCYLEFCQLQTSLTFSLANNSH